MGAALTAPPADAPDVPAADPVPGAAVTLRAATPQLTLLSAGERTLLAEWLDRVATP